MVAMSEVYTRVAAPPVAPHPYGLFAVTPPINPDGTTWRFGVTWESWACLDPNTTTDQCVNGGAIPAAKEFEACPNSDYADPITVYTAAKRSGGSDQVAQESASAVLADAEEYAVEKILWGLMLDDFGALPAAVNPAAALGLVEKDLGVNYHGLGVIHMDRLTATILDQHLVRSGSMLTTTLGTPVAVGAGYDFDSATPGAIFGTGAVALRRSVVSTYMAHNLSINDLLAIAERTYVVGWDCYITGRQATVTGGP